MDKSRLTKITDYNLYKNWCLKINKSCFLLAFNMFIMNRKYVILLQFRIISDLKNNQWKDYLENLNYISYMKYKDNFDRAQLIVCPAE